MDFDETRLYYSHQQLQTRPTDNDDNADYYHQHPQTDDVPVDLKAVRRHFREFLRNYRLGTRYVYREKLLRMHNRWTQQQQQQVVSTTGSNQTDWMISAINVNKAALSIDLAHIGEYDASLLGFLLEHPAYMLPALELATTDALKSLLYEQQQQQQDNTASQDDEQNDAAEQQQQQQQQQNNANNNNNSLTGISIQVLLQGNLQPTPLRCIKSEHMHRLLQCPGIIISTSPVKNRAVQLALRCPRCQEERILSATTENGGGGGGPFAAFTLPAKCSGEGCPSFPFTVNPDGSRFVDQQTLKLQEAPEQVPTGEMPRSILLAVERSLVDIAPPGTRVSVLCIPTLFTTSTGNNNKGGSGSGGDGQKAVYLRVVGLQRQNDAHGQAVTFTPAEEQAFQALSKRPDVYDILARSMAPNISGTYTVDIKKALACQLFSGSRKKLPDGVCLRGDINVLLLGDPSMAKSQFLKFVSQVAPIGIYTSGKGSSAAGLTASVVKDRKGEFYLEAGAMVLADGGIVCIDEFDKMRAQDRVAIHEAMEQQTISVAKAGITTVLNSRSSVLAAANPVFGRYDEFKSASENIDLMTTILSRFDLIFLVRDIREEERDRMICQHVMGVHMQHSGNGSGIGSGGSNDNHNGSSSSSGRDPLAATVGVATTSSSITGNADHGPASDSPEVIAENIMRVATTGEGELDVASMKKYIQYCKAKCSPRLGEEAGDVLTSSYVKIRDDVRKQAIQARGVAGEDTQATIPITVRQLEALVRLSESLAKMRLDSQVRSEDVTEALRLFKVSTMAANAADQQRTDSSFASVAAPNRAEMERTEVFLRSRLTIGSMVNKQKLVEEAAGQGFNAVLVARALSVMASRGDLIERNQGRLIKRVK